MGFNFPNSPTPGQVYTPVGGYSYVWLDGVWRVVENPQGVGTALPRNHLVNGAMLVSQENEDFGSSTDGYYPADQWRGFMSAGASGIVRTLSGTTGDYEISMTGTRASLAAGDYANLAQPIEGFRIIDFKWGKPIAKQAVLRFEAYSASISGTFTACVQNGAGDRSFLAPFTLTANTWKTVTIVIPGDTTGTWPVNNALGMYLMISFAVGSTYLGTAGWQAGDKQGITGMTNGYATANAFYLKNVGLYLDPQNTGIAPPWETPSYAEELTACMRYYYKRPSSDSYTLYGRYGGDTHRTIEVPHTVQMRTSPAVTVWGIVNYTGGTITLATTSYGYSWVAYRSGGAATDSVVTQGHVISARM